MTWKEFCRELAEKTGAPKRSMQVKMIAQFTDFEPSSIYAWIKGRRVPGTIRAMKSLFLAGKHFGISAKSIEWAFSQLPESAGAQND